MEFLAPVSQVVAFTHWLELTGRVGCECVHSSWWLVRPPLGLVSKPAYRISLFALVGASSQHGCFGAGSRFLVAQAPP